jgi:hypothetical protein
MIPRLTRNRRKTEPVLRARGAARSALLIAPLGALAAIAFADATPNVCPPGQVPAPRAGHTQTWYVNASAPAGGDGSAGAPFNTLAAVQDAFGPGDTIMIEPSTLTLNGGIALLPGQRLIGDGPPVVQFGPSLIPNGPQVVGPSGAASLPRITNTGTFLLGDAVQLASNTVVENLVIAGARRGGIYGQDALNVTIRGNDISGFNTSGTPGFVVQPFCLEQYAAGVANCGPNGINAGWAGILLDTASGHSSISIANNFVHDGVCGDGIDVRGMNTGDVTVQEENNFVSGLKQCSSVGTIEGIGTQVTGTSRMRATLVGNTEANNGSPGANMDSLFVNPAEAGVLTETIDHNVYLNGIGGASTNGMEFILSNGSANAKLVISNSFFRNNPGDMLEEFNRGGSGSRAELDLENVTVEQTTISRGLPVYGEPPGSAASPDNTGECLGIGSVGSNDTTILVMTDSSFTGCGNNGIEVTNNHPANGLDGPDAPHTISLSIDHSKISGSAFYNLWVNDVTPLTDLRVMVQDSDLSVSDSGVAVAFDIQPTTGATTSAQIDLGGGPLGSAGRNCIFDGFIHNLEATGYNVFAEHDWWGTPSGPPVGTVVESMPGFVVNTSGFLKQAPLACSGD